jgi:hypothetical protein
MSMARRALSQSRWGMHPTAPVQPDRRLPTKLDRICELQVQSLRKRRVTGTLTRMRLTRVTKGLLGAASLCAIANSTLGCSPLDCPGTAIDGKEDVVVTIYHVIQSAGGSEVEDIYCGQATVRLSDGNHFENMRRNNPDAGELVCQFFGARDRPGTYTACVDVPGYPRHLTERLVVRQLDDCSISGSGTRVVLNNIDGGVQSCP